MYDLYINVKTKLNLYILFYSVFTRRDLYTVKMPYKIKFYPISFLYTIYLLNIDKSSSNCIKKLTKIEQKPSLARTNNKLICNTHPI